MQTLLGALIPRYRWNEKFGNWAGPLSDTEDQRCQNAESVIRSAIAADPVLSGYNLRVFAQGSYKANTNVRADSDIDICICHQDVFFSQYPPGMSDANFGNHGAGLTFSAFKEHVQRALLNRFGYSGVTRGDKAFRVHENTYRINVDVVPTFEYRWYYRADNGTYPHASGVKFFSDAGKGTVNWPDQTYANGTKKNRETGWKYKQVIRILKTLRGEMRASNVSAAKDVSSFLIESLVWNVGNGYFVGDDLYDIVNKVVLHAWYQTCEDDRCKDWTEVNGIKTLFHYEQPWNRAKANAFLWAVREFVGFSSS